MLRQPLPLAAYADALSSLVETYTEPEEAEINVALRYAAKLLRQRAAARERRGAR